MNVYLYKNTKRLNSTKAAPSTAAAELTCVLKENTSFLNPVLKIKATSLPDANYMKFENRYYWITDIISLANNLWEIHGTCDVLTTFRGHILNTSAFVLYDSTPNTQLPDTRLAIETDVETNTSTASMPWGYTTGTGAGTYFIATVGEKDLMDIDFTPSSGAIISVQLQQNGRNGTGVYAIPYASLEQIGFDLSDVITALADIVNQGHTDAVQWLNYLNPTTLPADIVEALIRVFYGMANIATDVLIEYPTRLAMLVMQQLIGGGNALQNIKASYWLPFDVPSSALAGTLHTSNKLALGTYTDIVSGLQRVSDPVITAVDIPVTIPWKFNDWRDVSCTEIMLYIPLIGCISIPPEVVKGNDTIYLRFALNLYSGDLACEIYCDGGDLGTYGANCAMNILIGDSNINMGGAVNTVIAGITRNYAAMAGGVAETLSGMNTSVGGIGGGAGTGLSNQIKCIVRTHNTSQEPSALLATIGTPTRQLKSLSTSLGYCQCMNAQCSGAAVSGEPYPTQTELNEINNYLNTGVYLE